VPGHANACSPAAQARDLSLLRVRIITSREALGMRVLRAAARNRIRLLSELARDIAIGSAGAADLRP